MQNPIITLTTDFGQGDGYVGVMKGVILGICPWAQLVDLSHDVPVQDVVAGALLLESCEKYFPPGTIHLAVVDPRVGTDRPEVVLATPEAFFVGPDNGLLGLVWSSACARWSADDLQVIRLTESHFFLPRVSATFHGRDVFAPVAAQLARGTPVAELGTPARTIRHTPLPAPELQPDGSLIGQIVGVDRFGNCTTSLTERDLASVGPPESLYVRAGDRLLGELKRTYADVPPGQILALIGSADRLELAVREGNFSAATGLGNGALVVVSRGD